MFAAIILIACAYLLGSVPSGYVLGKLAGTDVRRVGSGNIGAANVARALGMLPGALTLVADAAKGYLPVFLALHFGFSQAVVASTAIAAFLGHLYPLFLKFHGGKGVATTMGALLAVAPMAALVLVLVFAGVVFVCRLVSLGAIAAAIAAPLILWLFYQPPVIVTMGFFMGAMVILRHHGNIRRLLSGTEPRFGER
ncbi:MAG: glycerol-3-phosphate 1-O-acyltransferase PlsY [Candidatus Binatia bacterium]